MLGIYRMIYCPFTPRTDRQISWKLLHRRQKSKLPIFSDMIYFFIPAPPVFFGGRSTNLSHRPVLMICNVLLPHSADLPTAKNKKTFPSMPSLITRKWAAEPPRVQALHSLQIRFPALLFLWAEATMKYRPCLPKVS